MPDKKIITVDDITPVQVDEALTDLHNDLMEGVEQQSEIAAEVLDKAIDSAQ